ncbi:DUF2066 domain-containing protein [Paraglaciecola sp. L3A3]|uniref:DUF2066 domain-containing protein n=1 Tax=Paraglaciecola sp. L3A3 TaxID=2686358 RepID=UPI00131DF6AF|nr:DUF2066 domain-containing protein [Paraglaciecola sp. L3A3]
MPIKFYSVSLTLLVFIVICSCHKANAAVIHDLFDTKIAVIDQSDNNQTNAFKQGLKQVLIKVRGKTDVLKNPQIRKGIVGAKRLVHSYRYENEQGQLYILISFDRERVENLIRNAGLPIWDKRRPDSIVWLAIQTSDSTSRAIVTADSQPRLFAQLEVQAKTRAIQLVYPLWDLDDVQQLTVYDIWGGFSQQIARASERYGVKSIISARIYPAAQVLSETEKQAPLSLTSNIWYADWTTIESGKLLAGQVQSDSIEQLGIKLVDILADQLSDKYSIDLNNLHSSKRKVEIVINNINSLQDYVDVSVFLENLSVVNSASLIKQKGARATFELDLLGEFSDLQNAFSLDNKVKPILDEYGQAMYESEFTWAK